MSRRTVQILALAALTQAVTPFTPAIVLYQLREPVPVRFYATPLPAALVLEADGRYVVHLSASLAALGSADAFAFSYLHEVGHVELGHLLPLGPGSITSHFPELDQALSWLREYEADRWAAVQSARAGYDPRAGFATLIARFGDGGGNSHPSDRERLFRLHWALVEDGHI